MCAPWRLVSCYARTVISPVRATAGDKMIINPGSVGLPAYEDPFRRPRACFGIGHSVARYVVLQLNGERASFANIAIPYDHFAAAGRAEETIVTRGRISSPPDMREVLRGS